MAMAFLQANARRIVVKVGTNTLTSGGRGIDVRRVQSLCSQVSTLRRRGFECIIVSSGAIGLGMGAIGLDARPKDLPTQQACASIGQTLLMETWRASFQAFEIVPAQILLTREDVRDRRRHTAVHDTMERLLSLGVVPIVNENDTVSADEIKFGDNDTLSALVASLTKADLLVILSTIRGLLDRANGDRLVPVVEEISPEITALAGGTDSPTAVGGMISKLEAAKIAMRSGCGVFIGDGSNPSILLQLANGEADGTFFVPGKIPLISRKRWLAFFERAQGRIVVDAGAVEAVRLHGKSLLAKGITGVEGDFPAEAVISVMGPDGTIFARGRSRFSAAELSDLRGASSDEVKKRFPDRKRGEVIHRDQLVVL
jgi:glutamate 5-kinase